MARGYHFAGKIVPSTKRQHRNNHSKTPLPTTEAKQPPNHSQKMRPDCAVNMMHQTAFVLIEY
jgi:hypothetical protein